jgi:hypothetical protein
LSDDKKERIKKKVDPLFEKRNEVNEHCRKFGITYKRFTNGQECSSYKDLKKNKEQLKQRGFK